MKKLNTSCRKGGFTLIEVLLVLVILVILASLAVVNIISAKKSADLKAAKIQVQLFDSLLQHYQLDVGAYPTTESGLQALRTQPSDLTDASKWAGPYSDKDIPLDPWNNKYQYIYPGTHNGEQKPDVWTVAPNGQNIDNWEAN